jgi:hypothetical protein
VTDRNIGRTHIFQSAVHVAVWLGMILFSLVLWGLVIHLILKVLSQWKLAQME